MFGKPILVHGNGLSENCSDYIPLSYLNQLKPRNPVPVVISGTDNVTFTVNASSIDPVYFWLGNNYIAAKQPISYTWTTGSNSILDENGTISTQTGSVLGIWYFYLFIDLEDENKSYRLIPSQTPPASPVSSQEEGQFGHPGNSKKTHYHYVGFHLCTNASLAFMGMTKVGQTYCISSSDAINQATSSTSYASASLSGAEALPTHQVSVSGSLETGSGGSTSIAYDSNGLGEIVLSTSSGTAQSPFSNFPLNQGDLYLKYTTASGNIYITQIHDVI